MHPYLTQHNTIKQHHNTTKYNTTTQQHNTTQRNTTARHSRTQYSTAQYSTQHNTAQHSTARHSTAQHSTAQHDTTRHGTARHGTSLQMWNHPHHAVIATQVTIWTVQFGQKRKYKASLNQAKVQVMHSNDSASNFHLAELRSKPLMLGRVERY